MEHICGSYHKDLQFVSEIIYHIYNNYFIEHYIGFIYISSSVEIVGLKTCVAFQGLAFTLQERQQLGIHGLMPARFKTQEEQLELCKTSVERYQEDLNKYLYLVELQVIHIWEC